MPEIDKMKLSFEDFQALDKFRAKYPTWWYRMGVCDLTRDFTAAPQSHSPEAKFILNGNRFDGGFAYDAQGTLADAIEQVMAEIAADVRFYSKVPEEVMTAVNRAFKNSHKGSENSARDIVQGIILDLDERESA